MTPLQQSQMRQCFGIRVSGYWKGFPCGAQAMVETADGKQWCKNHLPLNSDYRSLSKPRRTRDAI